MKKAAIFDMDGTLVANSPVHIRAFEIFCARYDVTDWREKLANGFGMEFHGGIRFRKVHAERQRAHAVTRRNFPGRGAILFVAIARHYQIIPFCRQLRGIFAADSR